MLHFVPARAPLLADLAVKGLLLALLLLAVVRPDLPQFEGKAMGGRALAYPLALAVVPVGWLLVRRRRGRPVAYPYATDVLVTLPFLIDTVGNALDLYDSIDWWDDLNHFVNWGLLTAGFGQLLLRLRLTPAVIFGLCVGFGAVTAILWELGEYFAFIRNSDELETAYTDTLGDLTLGLSGAVVAAVATAALASRRPRRGLDPALP
jgi:hypothetical protein